ncbi:CARD- and ANK-domain containing inflammasome adapter protein [Amia ocellicauda]|uniref:CARD- and ANK-domain containing inflammasome adapter protein n=1 Tax=Amia ocellicauda TaxID=2972642 RepID=UPI0034639AB1
MLSTSLFNNPYAIEVLQTKKKDLVEGISNTEHLLNLLIDKGILPPEKKVIMANYRSREEKNSRVLDILVSQGERACRLFFYPCLKLAEPDLYESIKEYVGDVNENIRDARRQLIGYLLERDHGGPVKIKQNQTPKALKAPEKPKRAVVPQKREKLRFSEPEKTVPLVKRTEEPKAVPPKPGGVFDAAAAGDLSLLEELLKGCDVNAVDSSKETLLHMAAAHGRVPVIEFLLSKGAKLDVRDSKGRTPLHRAAEKGHVQAVKFLVQAGADIYTLDSDSKTPAHLAAQNKHLSTVRALVEEETRSFRNHRAFLHMAALKDDSSLAQVLLQSGAPVDAKDNKQRTALFHAVNNGFERTARVLLEAGAQVDSGIIDAAFNHNSQSMYGLLLQYSKGLSPDTMLSALFKAVQRNLQGIVAALIDRGTDINGRNEMQYTPVLLAVELGHLETAKVLVAKKARLEERLPNQNSALHLAAQSGSLGVTQLLLEAGMDANVAGPGDMAPLHVAAFHNKPVLVEVLVRAGAQVNAPTRESLTALHIASQCGHDDVVSQLLRSKADVHAKDRQSWTALHYAGARAGAATVQQLLENSADPNVADKEKKTPLHLAALDGNSEAVSALLLGKARAGAKDMDGCTPLHYAAAKGHVRVAEALLASGKNNDDKNVWRKTPLHMAAEHGQDAVVDLLLPSGAKINALDNNRDTPLHCACRAGHLGTVRSLLGWTQGEKANLQATNSVKKTPLQVAESGQGEGHGQIVTLLKKKMLLIK